MKAIEAINKPIAQIGSIDRLIIPTMPPKRATKWGKAHKNRFRDLIQEKKINPNKSDRAYIDKINERYFQRPATTFRNNYKTSIAEWRIGAAINEANALNEGKNCDLVTALTSM